MNVLKKIYCRAFQAVFKLALPFLPYKDPKILQKTDEIGGVLKNSEKKKPLIVTDKAIHALGLCEGLEKNLEENGIDFSVVSRARIVGQSAPGRSL